MDKPETEPTLIRAGQLVDDLTRALRAGETSLDTIPLIMKAILLEQSWKDRRLRNGKVASHERFIDFITTKPLEGLGENPDTIKKLLRDDIATLALFEAACVGKVGSNQHTKGSSNPTTLPVDRGRAYTARRLAKDHPELWERVKAGELSANQAAIKAGFRKKPTPLESAQRSFTKLSVDERVEFLEWAEDQ